MIGPRCRQLPLTIRRWCCVAAAAGVIALAPVFAPGAALAQSNETQTLARSIERLERQLQALERAVYRGGAQPAPSSASPAQSGEALPPAAAAQLQLKTSQLEDQMRGLTGRIEQMGFEIRNVSERLDRLVADVDFRLRALEGAVGQSAPQAAAGSPAAQAPAAPAAPPRAAPSGESVAVNPSVAGARSGTLGTLTQRQLDAAGIGSSPAATDSAGQVAASTPAADQQASTGVPTSLPPGSPEDQYNYARSFLMRRDFAGAEQALRDFVAAHPESELAGNAQYWLGETFYVREDFGTAARTFAEGFQRYPDSSKAPDNLLKLGLSLAALERTGDACITLQKLENEYPDAPANIRQRAERERDNLKCQ